MGFALLEGRNKVRIPIEVNNNLVVIPVVINGQLPLKFILDTGVRTAILTEKVFSDILNLTYTRKYVVGGPGGQKLVQAYVTNNVSLDLPPGVHGEGHALLVLEEDYLELRNYLGADVQGILGYELFSRFIVTIDYERKELILYRPERFRPKRSMQKLKIAVQDTKPYIETTVTVKDSATIKAKLLIDSGASHGLILEPDSNDTIRVPQAHVNSIIGRGLGGVITGKIGRIGAVDLGKYDVKNVIANFPDPNSYMDTLKTSRSVRRNGAIGGEILSRFKVTFDFPREYLYLKKNSQYKKKFYYNMSGLTLKAKGSKLQHFEITDVREKSPAEEAGIKPGDLVLSINGLIASD
ncbi:MAG TPA: aspartyl protease family protein, partial [Cyclobacteriaceae bacterium]|nr:aspartyl protease family protein [Cyclobacteriaceae bacterium]